MRWIKVALYSIAKIKHQILTTLNFFQWPCSVCLSFDLSIVIVSLLSYHEHCKISEQSVSWYE